MRSLFLAASLLALSACGGTETANDTAVNDLAAVDNMLIDDGMNTGMATNMPTGPGTVTVTVNGVTANGGPVLVALQNQGQFAQSAGAYTATVQPSGATVTATISGVAPGTYAAAVVQDSNSDGSFTIGETGPAEPFGFSGTAQSGPPEFDAASFQVAETGGTATVNLSGGSE